MSYFLTFVSSGNKKPLTNKHVKEILRILTFYSLKPITKPNWTAKKQAAELELVDRPSGVLITHLRDFCKEDQIDVFTTPHANRKKSLLVADMDSTIVRGETLDDLASFAGIKDEISAITERAMKGELDFEAAIRERVALLKDLPASKLDEAMQELVLNPGAKTLVQTMKANGATCVLVSGGFTFFTSAVAELCGFKTHHGNILNIKDEKLTGTVGDPILTKDSKVEYLEKYTAENDLDLSQTMTIGDGANDLPMLKKSDSAGGLGVGYHAKPLVVEALNNQILYGNLTAALYAQGYTIKEIKPYL